MTKSEIEAHIISLTRDSEYNSLLYSLKREKRSLEENRALYIELKQDLNELNKQIFCKNDWFLIAHNLYANKYLPEACIALLQTYMYKMHFDLAMISWEKWRLNSRYCEWSDEDHCDVTEIKAWNESLSFRMKAKLVRRQISEEMTIESSYHDYLLEKD